VVNPARRSEGVPGENRGDAVIAKIMGDRYADVAKALDGSQQFRLAVPVAMVPANWPNKTNG